MVLEGIETNDQVRDKWLRIQPAEAFYGLIVLVNDLNLAAAKNYLGIGEAARCPLGEDMTAAGKTRSLSDDLCVAWASADKEDQAATVGDALDEAGRPAQMGSRLLQADYMDVLANAVDVASIGWVPLRRVMAHVRLRCHEQLQRHVFGARRVQEHVRWSVRLVHVGAYMRDLAP
jgi:hypothetical protein